MASAAYRFLPWVRRGLAGLAGPADAGAPLPQHATLAAGLTLTAGLAQAVELELYGPGDVIGLDPLTIIRTDPPADATDAEPNYLAAIEFDLPELPWLFTPAQAQGDRLRPWLVLVVLDADGPLAVAPPRVLATRPLPFVTLAAAQAVALLPDLAQSWSWAHAQLSVASGDRTASAAALDGDPRLNLARILCPRRLEPMRSYRACLVPAFDLGVARGLGREVAEGAELRPAWDPATPADLELPVYHHWAFATGPAGDFEALARGITPVACPAGVGRTALHVWDAVPGIVPPAGADQGPVAMDGVLRAPFSPAAALDEIDPAFRNILAHEIEASGDRTLGAPLYGAEHAGVAPLRPDSPPWLVELNLDPRARIAAGLGAEVVRINQELYVQACWEQAGAIGEANAQIDRGRLARAALGALHRRLGSLPPERQLAITAPMHARVPLGSATLRAAIARSSLPDASFAPALRRLASPRRRAIRKALRGGVGPAPVATEPAVQPPRTPDPVASNGPSSPAFRELVARLALGPESRPPVRPGLALAAARDAVARATDPARTVPARVAAMIGGGSDQAAAKLAPQVVAPVLAEPVFHRLAELDPAIFLPGAEHLAPETMTLVAANPRFIEAFMVGLNHEMNRELLWRGFAGDRRGTPFARFWDRADDTPDIAPIERWATSSPLGGNPAGAAPADMLVLLVRGRLLGRYPGSVIAAWRAEQRDGRAMLMRDPRVGNDPRSADYVPAALFGRCGADIGFAGFAMSDADLLAGAGWFFVIEQQATAPRFGFDEAPPGARPVRPASWLDARWLDTGTAPGGHLDVTGRLAGHAAGGVGFARDAGHFAALALQRPFRLAIHARHLVAARAAS